MKLFQKRRRGVYRYATGILPLPIKPAGYHECVINLSASSGWSCSLQRCREIRYPVACFTVWSDISGFCNPMTPCLGRFMPEKHKPSHYARPPIAVTRRTARFRLHQSRRTARLKPASPATSPMPASSPPRGEPSAGRSGDELLPRGWPSP
ncbi:hypothetical protein KCP73_18495 [Salmonella enterica subsp. enterica]|nr:hypothetical protein KCP73_18495 [Salmonella enterica subsp. enterica]